MSNYCDEAFYQQNIYTNTYSLWENSAYYDINNLSPQNFSSSWHRGNDEDFETRYTSGPTESEAPEPPDPRNRRIVDKASLYEDPELFYRDVTEGSSTPPPADWAHVNWRPGDADEGPSGKNKAKLVRPNRVQKKVDKVLVKPVKMSKAESMMQKMGWHGALGRGGGAILDPITSNAVYATKKLQPKQLKLDNKDHFTLNVLYHIYEFVKNNGEIELLFDRRLVNEERKVIHNIVKFMLNVVGSEVQFESNAHMDLVMQICDVNCYILHAQAQGEHPNRRMCIYKEAPAHVYLIIPDDVRPEPDAELSDTEPEEETNPFLRSITRNLKKNRLHKNVLTKEARIFEKILEYFVEFTEKKQYSQLKFLGPFSEDEWGGIRLFLEKAAQGLEGGSDVPAFHNVDYEIAEDITGNTVINKRPK
ncbi:uncharacterized protein LOC142984579 [Anticarsia gemmatalis]|uniref:uncharacterized protein LOC142984579 n=1 Tax=Anticarsia gemmatalis TaxID=129554 RepID=UPI003F76ECAB